MNWSHGASFILVYDFQLDGALSSKQSNSLLKVNVNLFSYCHRNGELPKYIKI